MDEVKVSLDHIGQLSKPTEPEIISQISKRIGEQPETFSYGNLGDFTYKV